MTNKDFMCTLDAATFAEVMHDLYYAGRLWIEGSDVKKMSTPTVFDVREWLDKPFDPETEFWKYAIGEIKEVKIDKDDKEAADKLNKRMDMINSNSVYGMFKSDKEALAQEVKKVLNEKYGAPKKGVEGIDYGYGPTPKNTSYCSYYAAGHDIAKGVFKLMQATIDDLKHDPEFKELIKQAVKEAYEEV